MLLGLYGLENTYARIHHGKDCNSTENKQQLRGEIPGDPRARCNTIHLLLKAPRKKNMYQHTLTHSWYFSLFKRCSWGRFYPLSASKLLAVLLAFHFFQLEYKLTFAMQKVEPSPVTRNPQYPINIYIFALLKVECKRHIKFHN